MSIPYTISYTGTVTAAGGNADLLEITPGDDAPVHLRRLWMATTSELGEAQEEWMQFSVIRMTATVTSSNGSAVTPRPYDTRMPAAVMAAEANGATVATTTGSTLILGEYAMNVRAGAELFFGDESQFQPTVRQGEVLLIRNNSTLADDATITIAAEVIED